VDVYVHRVGRTSRAGKTGIAISLITPREQWRLRQIEAYTKQKITRSELPTVEDIQKQREAQLLEQMTVWLRRGRCRREREMVTELVEQGHDPLEIAAVALKLSRAEEKQRPIAPVSEVEEWRPQKNGRAGKRANGRNGREQVNDSHERGMVRLSLNTGKAHGLRANHVVGTLAYHADIPGHSIGKIQIQDRHTLVDVPEEFVGQVLAKTGSYRIGKQAITVERV
jgi:ATP-dependent RNA helicase DeaD